MLICLCAACICVEILEIASKISIQTNRQTISHKFLIPTIRNITQIFIIIIICISIRSKTNVDNKSSQSILDPKFSIENNA